jgi:hemerythrin
MMEKYGYEGFEAQKFEHHFVIKKIQRFEKSDIDKNQSSVIIDLVAFVSDWISGHILKEDMKYKNFFNSKGVY